MDFSLHLSQGVWGNMKAPLALAGAIVACGTALAVPAGASAGERTPQLRMLAAVNEVRAKHGLGALRGSRSLHRSARSYARYMLRRDYFGHLGRIRASSRFSLLGENLAWHSGRRPGVSRTVRSWMRSAPHRALILHPGFRWLGAGLARGRLGRRGVTAWVLHLGGPIASLGAALPAAPEGVGQAGSEATALSAPVEITSTTSAAGASRASAAP
jgi:uncharacterized protein YkwD